MSLRSKILKWINDPYADLEEWMHESYPHVPCFYTTELNGKRASKCRPSEEMKAVFDDIKYGKGLNVYWHVDYYDEFKRGVAKAKGNSKGGKKSKRSITISDSELRKRAKGKGKQARNARLLLKNRGKRLN